MSAVVTVEMGAVTYRATADSNAAAMTTVQAVHVALTDLGFEAWVSLPGFHRDEWGALRQTPNVGRKITRAGGEQ